MNEYDDAVDGFGFGVKTASKMRVVWGPPPNPLTSTASHSDLLWPSQQMLIWMHISTFDDDTYVLV